MIIKGKIAVVYDIEVFPNLFTCTLKNTETKQVCVVELSERKDNINILYDIFENDKYIFVGYNNIHYDNVLINMLLKHKKTVKSLYTQRIIDALFNLTCIIISGDDIDKWKEYKYFGKYATLDLLTMLFSSKLRVSLKEIQVTMKYPNVEEYSGRFDVPVMKHEIDDVLKYNLNDVESTETLLYKCEKDIRLREGIEEEYKVNILSSDGVSIGKEILKTKYLQDTNKNWLDIKDLRTPCERVPLNDVILPIVEYKSDILKDLLKRMKQMTVSPGIKGWNEQFMFHNSLISIGVGGLHSVNTPQTFIPENDEVILDVDFASLYPSLLISWGFQPQHLGKEFLNTYSNIRTERLEAKHNGNKVKNETLKLTLNSVTGLMQNEYSWLYSPKDVMRIRMNGQLLLLMLAENLIDSCNCLIFNYNTDGLYLICKKNKLDLFHLKVKEFEQLSKLQLEEDRYEKVYQFAVNDYVAVGKGYSETHDENLLKKKGLFIDKVSLGKGMQPMIIPKAINKFLVDGIPITDTVYNSKNINDFITYQKVGKQFDVYYGNDKVTHINRFYMSTNGNYLIKKYKQSDKCGKIVATSGVTIVNDLTKITEFPKNINYSYYLKEISKVVDAFNVKQLTLF